MFYAHFVLAKKGPLARIWLAAHWDKKLTKAHVYETNIEQSVDGIMQPKVKMALRTSGHLLLGVVRIYSRKAKYLLADCNEAFVKIKMAFRPGMVDLPEDKREAAMNAITLPDVFHDFDTDLMPDLDDMDIQAQFSLHTRTRAEEITMREDYGNISLTVGEADYEMDDGFGGGGVAAAMSVMSEFAEEQQQPPEMLREAAASASGAEVSLEPSLLREEEEEEGGRRRRLSAASLLAREKFRLEAPIRDDGFGGGVGGLVQEELMAGGLFEGGGTLFEEPTTPGMPSPAATEEADFLPPASPMMSEGESRPGTPASLLGDMLEPTAAPTLDQTPVVVSPQPQAGVLTSGRAEELAAGAAAAHEQTTLLHNEVESFALAPVEASALGRAAGGDRRKRKRKLIVDEVKAISGEGMKAQLSDSADIVTTLDIAPPTKRLMHWKETGGVEELFSLPARTLGARNIFRFYQSCLKQIPVGVAADEHFDTLYGDQDREQLRLVQIGGPVVAAAAAAERLTKKEKPAVVAAGKRKRGAEAAESAYAKRQQELARRQEEFAQEEAARRQQQQLAISLPREEPEEGRQQLAGTPLPPPEGLEETGLSPAPSGGGSRPPSPLGGFPSPMHEQEDLLMTPSTAVLTSPPAAAIGPPTADLTFAQQVTLTEQWVSQVQTPAVGLPADEEEGDHLGGFEGEGGKPCGGEEEEEEEAFPADIEPVVAVGAGSGGVGPQDESAMQEDETIEQYEDRVLNKRAAQMHRHLAKRFESARGEDIELDSLLRNNNRKQVAQKFYSILVLQKVMAVEANQSVEAPFGPIRIAKGSKFEAALQNL